MQFMHFPSIFALLAVFGALNDLGGSKIEVFETCFYDILTTQYDHPRYVRHVYSRISVFFTLFGY